ncbi:MAG: DUF4846 domain-containing protein [Flavobacteriales bacterium]|nr:DUF4846 domain-containing protein [Flavobacteriales bacterium]
MTRYFLGCAGAYLALSCTSPAIPDEGITPTLRIAPTPTGHTVATRFEAPAGCTRTPLADSTFGSYLRALPVKPEGAPVHLYDGSVKHRQDVHAAVVDLSVGKRDLQQCADAVMRLRAEHLFAQGRYEDIHFRFTNGFEAPFSRWAKGDRIKVQGDRCDWKLKEGVPGFTHDNLLAYLQLVFTYAGTLSLSKELKPAHALPLEPGDVFIHGGSPGHAMLVLDVARGPDGRTFFLLAQSYMPAQEVHVVRNLRRPALGAWFELNDGDELVTPEWTFSWSERKRW